MRCFRFKKLLIPYIEGGLDERAQAKLEQHLASCEHCRMELQGIRAISSALRSADAPAVEPANDLWAKVNARIADERTPSRPWLRITQVTSAAAVAVLVAVIGISLLRPGVAPSRLPAQSATPDVQIATKLPEPELNTGYGAESVNSKLVKKSDKPQFPDGHVTKIPKRLPSLASNSRPSVSSNSLITDSKRPTLPALPRKHKLSSQTRMASAQTYGSAGNNNYKFDFGDSSPSDGDHVKSGLAWKTDVHGEPAASRSALAEQSINSKALSLAEQPSAFRHNDTFAAKSAIPSLALGACGNMSPAPATDKIAATTDKKGNDSVVDELNKTEGVHTAALFQYP